MKIHSARLIAISQPTPEIIRELGVNSPEGLTAYVTRVSNPINQSNTSIEGLLRYCAKHGHWSIFETVNMTFEIHTTRDISAQIIRHWSMRFQEFSQRYAEVQEYELPMLRIQDPKDRQNSILIDDADESVMSKLRHEALTQIVAEHLEKTYELYQMLLDSNVAKETARRILPICATTKLYMTGNIRSFIFYIKSRSTSDGKAQLEHQWVADSIEQIFAERFPIIYDALF